MDDQLAALQQVIQDMHSLMTVLKDPNDTSVVAQCLNQLTRVQKEMMVNRAQPDRRQAMAQQLTGGQGGSAY